MKTILVNTKDKEKTINNRKFGEMIKDFSEKEEEYILIKNVFNNINSEEELILELKKLKAITTPASIMLIIKVIGNFSLIDANPIFDKVMSE